MRSLRPVLVAFALRGVSAHAQPMPVASLRVEPGDEGSCPDAAALRAEVDRRLGRPSFADDAPRAIVVRYRPAARGRRRAQVLVREGDGPEQRRELSQEGPGCEALADAVALAVALVIDPDAALAPPPSPAPVCPEPAAPVCPACPACPAPLPPPPAPRPAAPSPARPAPWIALAGSVFVGVAPAAAPAVGLSVTAALDGRWSLDLGVTYLPPVATVDGTASVGLTAARVGACVDTDPSWIRVGGCASALAGALHLAALALQPVDPGDRAWVGAAAEAHAQLLPGGRWVIAALARAVVPLLTWAPRVEGAAAPSFAPAPVAFEAGISLGVRLR